MAEQMFSSVQQNILKQVQVNIPYSWFRRANWLELFVSNDINPEIGLDAAALDTIAPDEFAKTAALFHRRGCTITIHGPFIDLSPGSTDPEILDTTRHRLEQMLSVIDIFKPETVVCHAGYDVTRYGFIHEDWLSQCIRTWQWVGEKLHEKGCRLMLENVYESAPSELLDVLSPLPPDHTGCCLDVGHLTAFGHAPLSEWIDALASRIGQLHLHDNCGDMDHHLGMGEGKIDFNAVRALLTQSNPRPVVTLEPHTTEDLMTSIGFLDREQWFLP